MFKKFECISTTIGNIKNSINRIIKWENMELSIENRLIEKKKKFKMDIKFLLMEIGDDCKNMSYRNYVISCYNHLIKRVDWNELFEYYKDDNVDDMECILENWYDNIKLDDSDKWNDLYDNLSYDFIERVKTKNFEELE